jgi:hypothetical protein
MADEFTSTSDSPISPARNALAVTPHDTNALANVSKALYVGGAGNIVVRLADDSADVTFTGVTAGSILPIRASHVRATSTTATSIVNMY